VFDHVLVRRGKNGESRFNPLVNTNLEVLLGAFARKVTAYNNDGSFGRREIWSVVGNSRGLKRLEPVTVVALFREDFVRVRSLGKINNAGDGRIDRLLAVEIGHHGRV
jgi:hypothetical protein